MQNVRHVTTTIFLPGSPWHTPPNGYPRAHLRHPPGATAAGALVGFYLNRIAGGMRDHVAVYVWRRFRQQREFRPNLEIAQCAWFDVHALPADIGKGTARRIREIFDGLPRDAEW